MSILSRHILNEQRARYIHLIKYNLLRVIVSLGAMYIEATKEKCEQPNSHVLMAIRDKFFEYENNSGREQLFRALFRILIGEYESDPYYRHRIDWIVEQVREREWAPRIRTRPSRGGDMWREPLEKEMLEDTIYEVLEDGQNCSCGGVVDRRHFLNPDEQIWRGKCFQCGKNYTVVAVKKKEQKEVFASLHPEWVE